MEYLRIPDVVLCVAHFPQRLELLHGHRIDLRLLACRFVASGRWFRDFPLRLALPSASECANDFGVCRFDNVFGVRIRCHVCAVEFRVTNARIDDGLHAVFVCASVDHGRRFVGLRVDGGGIVAAVALVGIEARQVGAYEAGIGIVRGIVEEMFITAVRLGVGQGWLRA